MAAINKASTLPGRKTPSSFGIHPIQRQKTHTMILQELVHFIKKKNLQRGDQIPPERKLAEMMEVSRPVIREAFSILQWLGVVNRKPGAGIRFIKLPEGDFVSPSGILLFSEGEDYSELFEVRSLLEKEAAVLAAKRRNSEDLGKMEMWLEKSVLALKAGQSGIEELFQFHRSIMLASNNPLLVKIYDAISDALRQAMEFSHRRTLTVDGEPEKGIEEHQKIFLAIKSGNSVKARQAVLKHLEHRREKIVPPISRK
jgi:GntR family transcriptional regulator, transcriptional repressor for pyruvate dehydrogenase complex